MGSGRSLPMHIEWYLTFGVGFSCCCWFVLWGFAAVVVFLPLSLSSGLDHLGKEIEERVTRLENCISFLVDSFKHVCHDYPSIFIS